MARYLGFPPYNGNDSYGFISYKSEEEKRIRPYASSFYKSGLRLWYDDGIPLGSKWDEIISERINDSLLVILFVSEKIFYSEEIKKEFRVAKLCNIPIIPIFLEPLTSVPNNQIMFYEEIMGIQGINAYNKDVGFVTAELIHKISELGIVRDGYRKNIGNMSVGYPSYSDTVNGENGYQSGYQSTQGNSYSGKAKTGSKGLYIATGCAVVLLLFFVTRGIVSRITKPSLEDNANAIPSVSVTDIETANENDSGVRYLGSDISAYDFGIYYTEYDGGEETFSLGGKQYNRGFTIGSYPAGAYASYNLDGQYKYFTGMAGNVDNINYSYSYVVYGDDNIIGTIDIMGGGLPVEFSFDVTGVKQLKIVPDGDQNHGDASGFANVTVSVEPVDEPILPENNVQNKKAYLGKTIKAYQHGIYYEECDEDGESVTIQGDKYYYGFEIGTYSEGYAYFNLNGDYSTLTGKVGFKERAYDGISYYVYGDNDLIGIIELNSSTGQSFSFNVTSVKQLKIVAGSDNNYGNAVSFGDVLVE